MSKIKVEHKELIRPFLESVLSAKQAEIKEHVKTLRVLHIQGKVNDLEKRLCFDILYSTPISVNREFHAKVYDYANDDHIYTLLKSIIKPKNLLK